MVNRFEYEGYRYERIPKEEVIIYANEDNNIFIIGNIMSERKMELCIETDIEGFIKEGLLFNIPIKNRFQKILNTIDIYVGQYDRIWSIDIDDYYCFIGTKVS